MDSLDGLPLFNPSILEQSLGDDEETKKEVLAAFFEQAGSQLARLEETARSNDLAAVTAQVHQLRGSAADIGAQRVQALTKAMEEKARSGVPQDLPGGIRQIAAEIAALRDHLNHR